MRSSGPRSRARRPVALPALTCLLALSAAACSSDAPEARSAAAAPEQTAKAATGAPAAATAGTRGRPGVTLKPLTTRYRADVLVTGPATFSTATTARLTKLARASITFRSGKVRMDGHQVDAVAVDPARYRAFTAQGTAEATAVWQSIARGEAVTSHELATGLKLALGKDLRAAPSGAGKSTSLRLGALATTGVPGTDLLLDDATGKALGLKERTGMLLSAGPGVDPVTLASKVRAITGTGASVDLLTAPAANPVAFLSGSRAAKAFGAFSYRYFPDGTIQPDAAWVRNNIVSATVPIFGRVTCHRLMVEQLRGALQDIVEAGLAGSLTTYDGCYVPRFIERNPENSISLHTWGIAIDLDAATNYRGITGTMDPKVVQIFKSWGFRWGGDWSYTDPMHFELGALLSSPRR
ncbi:MAG: M15 family metallopeptidase [Mycobacteriales bacterium]|nr:M15 family metallopeptidase [Mycobacteriales bacterium]